MAAATTEESRASAASRFRSCERCSEAVIVSTPPTNRPASRSIALAFSPGESKSEPARSQDNSTRESVVFTPCPPGPLEREKRQFSSPSGMSRPGRISTSAMRSPLQIAGRGNRWCSRPDRRGRSRARIATRARPPGWSGGRSPVRPQACRSGFHPDRSSATWLSTGRGRSRAGIVPDRA